MASSTTSGTGQLVTSDAYTRAESSQSVPFSTKKKAWGRLLELVVYDPANVGTSGLTASGETLGLVVSSLDTEFRVTRSRTYSENTAEFKVYNAKAETRARLTTPGMRVRFSAGYEDQGGLAVIFWGSISEGSKTEKRGADWVTTVNCISSLTEATGTEDIATWAKQHPKATDAQKQAVITSAINRIPVSLSYGPGTPIRKVLSEIQAMTGLSVYGLETMPSASLKNGFSYVGGIRGALDQFIKQCLKPMFWNLYIDNTTIFLYPMDDKQAYVVTAVYLTLSTGYLSSTDKTKDNIPPKVVKTGGTVKTGISVMVKNVPRVYEVKCLLNPKIAPNTLAYIDTPGLYTTLLIDKVDFEGNNFGAGFDCTFEGHVYQGSK